MKTNFSIIIFWLCYSIFVALFLLIFPDRPDIGYQVEVASEILISLLAVGFTGIAVTTIQLKRLQLLGSVCFGSGLSAVFFCGVQLWSYLQ